MCLHLPEWLVIPFRPELLGTFFNEFYSLKKLKTDFLKRQNLIFFIVAQRISFVFCLRLNIFTSKISNFYLPFVTERAE